MNNNRVFYCRKMRYILHSDVSKEPVWFSVPTLRKRSKNFTQYPDFFQKREVIPSI